MRLTRVGAAVLPYARAALEAVAGARLAVDELTGLLRGHVKVGMLTACGLGGPVRDAAGVHQRHPAVEIALSEANSDKLLAGLLAATLTWHWSGWRPTGLLGIETQVLVDEALVAA